MRNINDHAQLLHPFNEGKAFSGQSVCAVKGAKTARGEIGACQLVRIVPCEGHHARTALIERLKVCNLPLAASALLDGHERGHLSLFLVCKDFMIGGYDADLVLIFLHLIIKYINQF